MSKLQPDGRTDEERARDLLGIVATLPATDPRAAGLAELGELSIARDGHGVPLDPIQIRSEPLPYFGYCEFRFRLSEFDRPGTDPVGRLTKAAAIFQKARRRVVQRAEEIRAFVLPRLDAFATGIAPLRLIGFGLEAVSPRRIFLVVDLEMLDHDLVVRPHRVCALDLSALDRKLGRRLVEHRERVRLLASARAARARGWVDGATLRIIDAGSLTLAEVIGRLLVEEVVMFNFADRHGGVHDARLVWDEGAIRGEFEDITGDVGLARDELILASGMLPEAVQVSAVGRRLGEVVDHPMIPADTLIVGVKSDERAIRLSLALEFLLIDEAAGEARPQPRAREAA